MWAVWEGGGGALDCTDGASCLWRRPTLTMAYYSCSGLYVVYVAVRPTARRPVGYGRPRVDGPLTVLVCVLLPVFCACAFFSCRRVCSLSGSGAVLPHG